MSSLAVKAVYVLSQVIANAEENLKDFEQRISELKTTGGALQADEISINKILKLQVTILTVFVFTIVNINT